MKMRPRGRSKRLSRIANPRPSLEPLEGRRLFAGGLDWSTFLGGSSDDDIWDIAAVPDGSGDVVVTGGTGSADFPATGGARPPQDPNGFPTSTAYVARLSGDGKRLIYASYFGGTAGSPRGVAVAADGSAVVVGGIVGSGFTTTPGAFSTPRTEDGDQVFAARFDPSGRLVFASAFGGSAGATATGVGLDGAGNVVLSGYTNSADFPTTPGAYDRTINQRVVDGERETTTDAFVSRLSADGTRLTYSTFLGGEGDDEANAVAVDPQGFVTLVGETNAAGERERDDGTIEFIGRPFPTTADAFQRQFQEQEDAFVARLKLDGAGAADLKYGSILGSVGEDMAWAVAHDPSDPLKVVVTTQTDGWNFPTTPGALQRTRVHPDLEGDPDLGVTAFRFGQASGGRLEWSTLHGQIAAYISEVDVGIDNSGDVILAGAQERYTFGGQNDRPVTQGAYQATPGEHPGFISRLSGDGRQLLYATNFEFVGNAQQRLTVVGPDSVVVAGTTTRREFPTTAGSFDRTLNDGTLQSNEPEDGYLARLTLTPLDPTDTTGPSAPALVTPADGAQFRAFTPEGSATIVRFDWTDVTDPSGVRLYELEVGHNAEFVQNNETDDERTLERSETSEAQVNMSDLGQGHLYHWRVRALDGANNFGPWSEARTFVLGEAGEPRLAAALVIPDGAPAGTPVLGKVLLQGVAPAGGTRVTLTSSDRDLLSVPASVTVPAGASSATFPVTTRPVGVSTPVWIEAELGEEWTAPVLWIDPGAAPPPDAALQAESARRSGAVVSATHPGYTGTGFVDFRNASGDFVEFSTPAASGFYGMEFRYANGSSTSRTMDLVVNGRNVGRVTFAPTGSWATWKTLTLAPAQLSRPASGANTVRLVATGQSGPNLDALTLRPVGKTTHQAESATRGGAVVSSVHRGFTGTGYVDFRHATGDFAEFRVNAAAAGQYTLKFRYANGGRAARAMGLSVNGAARPGGLSFAGTGSWSTWREVSVVVQLAAGANRIRLTATGQSGPNLDSLIVVG